jgi:hypothetical protein
MDIQDIRRANLMRWLETHTTPKDEKSLFSQLKAGGSFGERVARRLEADYGMGAGFLDLAQEIYSPIRGQNTPLSNEAKSLITKIERIDGLGGQARKIFSHMGSILVLAESMGDPHNSKSAKALIEEEQFLGSVAGSERPGVKHHAARKRAAK